MFNGKLRDECLNGEIFYSLKEAIVVLEQWRNQYNTIRPHSSLNYRPPAPQTSTAYHFTWIAVTRCNSLHSAGPKYPSGHFIDATFAMAKGGGAEIGPTKRGKGLKIMAIVDRHGLPLSVSTHAANHHEVRLVQLFLTFT